MPGMGITVLCLPMDKQGLVNPIQWLDMELIKVGLSDLYNLMANSFLYLKEHKRL